MSHRRDKKKAIVITSVVISVVTMIVMTIYRQSLGKSTIVKRLIQYKRLASDGLKDFFEIHELNLRLEKVKDEKEESMKPIYDGVKIIWDSDSSESYIILISHEWISKMTALNIDNIQELKEEDIESLEDQKEWIRKIIIKDVLYYNVPFDKFQCRIRSSRGRVSRILTYPTRRRIKLEEKPILAWISKVSGKYYMSIQESNVKNAPKIHEYKIVLYMNEGRGVIRTVPPFKNFTMVELGELPSCLCYIRGMRSIGTVIEQFVKWIGEEEAMVIDVE